MKGANHWLNHAMFSPSGQKLIIMHRWGIDRWRRSRLYCVGMNHETPVLLLDDEMISHYHWLDERRIIAYCRAGSGDGYYVIDAENRQSVLVDSPELQSLGDGHPAVTTNNSLVVTDTYPDRRGVQALSVFSPDTPSIPPLTVARVAHSPAYHGHQRCDLHPRWHPTEAIISIDSVLDGRRRCWVLDCRDMLSSVVSHTANKSGMAP